MVDRWYECNRIDWEAASPAAHLRLRARVNSRSLECVDSGTNKLARHLAPCPRIDFAPERLNTGLLIQVELATTVT